MGWTVKGQKPSSYRPKNTRRPSGLTSIKERNLWARIRSAIRTKQLFAPSPVRRGRFTVYNPAPKSRSPSRVTQWKHTAPGIYFVGPRTKKGRFTVEDIRGFVPMP